MLFDPQESLGVAVMREILRTTAAQRRISSVKGMVPYPSLQQSSVISYLMPGKTGTSMSQIVSTAEVQS
jgi:hypothetical protein